MFGTRRLPSTGGGRHATSDSDDARSEREDKDTIHIQTPHSSKICNVPSTPKSSTVTSTVTPSSTGGMEGISLNSSSNSKSVQCVLVKMPKRKRPVHPVPDCTLSSALRRLAPKSETSKGSAENPIDLDAYSPRRRPVPLTKRQQLDPEPHKFLKRHQKLYKVGHGHDAPRFAFATRPANGITFTGHKGDDMYRMVSAKMIATGKAPLVPQEALPQLTDQAPPAVPYDAPPPTNYYHPPQAGHSYGIPFEVLYPMSARYRAQQPAQYQSPYVQYHTQMNVSLSGHSEDMLRKKAVQYAHESSRPLRSESLLSDSLDETSASDSDATILIAATDSRSANECSKRRKLHVLRDREDQTSPLIAQTSLLTSLLQLYSRSTDQSGLREDIGTLVSSTICSVQAWMRAESRESLGLKGAVYGILEHEDAEDDDVRGLLSARAGIWGGGNEGIADVYAPQFVASADEAVSKREEFDGGRTKGVCGWAMVF